MQSKDFAIGVLATTAAILLVGLAVVSHSGAAYADGMTTSAGSGGYILTVGSFNRPDEEFVYVFDSTTDRMVAYRFDVNRRQMELVEGIDLAEIRRAAGPSNQPQAPGTPAPSRRPAGMPPAQPPPATPPQQP